MTTFCPKSRRILVSSIGTFTLLALAGTSLAQPLGARVEIKDGAGMFSQQAIARAREALGKNLAGKRNIPIVIETVQDLGDQSIDEATRRNHRRETGGEGVYILASRRDHKLEVSRGAGNLLSEPLRRKIQDAFIAGFKQGDFDKGLELGTDAIIEGLAVTGARGGRPGGAGEVEGSPSLVLRNQVRLTLSGAHRILEGSVKKATEMGLKMNIAVVDDGGHMVAFARMDGARPASGYTATTKAITAATFRAPSGPIPAGTTSPDPLLNLSLQSAALASGGKITTLLGGVPVVVDDQVIGGVGVGGGTGEQDATVARAGIDAFLAALKAPSETPKEAAPADK